MRVVIMGVSGCGKSTVGATLATRLGWHFFDGDDLHPAANIEKMSAGIPLTDADRAPWLNKVAETLRDAPQSLIIGCSALKRAYRDHIRATAGEDVKFLHLSAPKSVIAARLADREGHFMPESLLNSQYNDLMPLEADERGTTLDISGTFDATLKAAADYLKGEAQ
ncbi:MAG: gluconokinase [Pseudomonadota bacterium]